MIDMLCIHLINNFINVEKEEFSNCKENKKFEYL